MRNSQNLLSFFVKKGLTQLSSHAIIVKRLRERVVEQVTRAACRVDENLHHIRIQIIIKTSLIENFNECKQKKLDMADQK